MSRNGVTLKFYGPWQRAAGVEELFMPQDGVTTVRCLLKKLEARCGEEFSSHGEGLVCLYDSGKGPRALDLDEEILPGSTILFLGIVESG